MADVAPAPAPIEQQTHQCQPQQPQQPQPGREPAEAADASPSSRQDAAQDDDAPQIAFRITYGKQSAELKRPASSTVAELKAEVERHTGIAPDKQKLMFKGMLKDDSQTLLSVGIKNGAKVLLIGSSQADIAAAKPGSSGGGAAGDGSKLAWDNKVQEDICKQPQHAKIIAKGPSKDVLPGIPDKQVPFPDELVHINGLYNSTGSQVRLTFKAELQQLWIASAASTQKIPYSSITKIDSWLIEGQPGYSMLALHLGAGGASKYWLYFMPSQYVAGLKIRLIGVHALL